MSRKIDKLERLAADGANPYEAKLAAQLAQELRGKEVARGSMTAEKLCVLVQKTPYTIPTSMGPLTVPGNPVPAIVCADGFKMSVQAGQYTYCTPRQNQGPWTHVEVGFPSAREESLMPYIDGSEDDPTGTVYGYVPVEVVVAIINRHGGAL